MAEETPRPELTDLERALAGLTPAPPQLDRDRLMFRAGQASVPRRSWAWPTATAAFAVLAAVLGTVLISRPGLQVRERVVYVEVPAPAPAPPPPAPLSPADTGPVASVGYTAATHADPARLRSQVLRGGVDALPAATPAAVAAHRDSTFGRLLSEIEQ
jgi:hypothetical protein